MHIASLFTHPVKGGRAVQCEGSRVTARGLASDRCWLVTDAQGVFLTQRNCAALAKIIATPTPSGVRLASETMDADIDVSFPENTPRQTITIWGDNVDAVLAGAAACDWLSAALGRNGRFYFMDTDAERRTSDKWGVPAPVSFADAFPVLITTTASLAALNQEIARNGGAAVGMERFRPNIVVAATDSWSEDFWKTIRLGDVVFDLVKPCDRCVVTTKDQQSGEAMGKEPLTSLAIIRRSADPRINGVLFGWNAVPRNQGEIAVGDALVIIEPRPEGWPLAVAP